MNTQAEQESHIKIPPHSIDAERAVLAVMMSHNDAIHDLEWLRTSDFYKREHKVIHEALSAMAMQGKPADAVNLVAELQGLGKLEDAGGYEAVVELSTEYASRSNASHYAQIVRDRSLSRQIICAGRQIASAGFDSLPVQEQLDLAQRLVMDLTPGEFDEAKHINQAMRSTIQELQRRADAGDELLGLSTGLKDLDAKTQGLQDGDLIVIAGRPSMGKTALAGNIAEQAVLDGKFVIFFSLEMPHQQIVMRMISSVGHIPFAEVKSGKFSEAGSAGISAVAGKVKDKDFYIDDSSRLTSTQLLSRVRKIEQRVGRKADVVIVDYLQLMTDRSGEGETQRITDMSRNIKLAARELNCPVVLLSQLNRSLEQRHDKRPLMSDLRQSGAIEQDADLILMMYRDEVYDEDSQYKGIAEIIVRKQRNGETGTILASALLHQMRFENFAPGEMPLPAATKKSSGFQFMEQFDD